MKMKRFIPLALTLLLLFSLTSCGIKEAIKPDDTGSSEKTQETQTVEEKPIIKLDDNAKKDEEEEEIADDRPDDPPFVKTLRTGVFGYEYRAVTAAGAAGATTFLYSDGSRVVCGFFDADGEFSPGVGRSIFDYEKNEAYVTTDTKKSFSVIPDASVMFFHMHGAPDYRAGIEQTGHGTADCNGETLDYIDYISGQLEIRFFIKDGDTYAMRHPESDSFTFFFTKTYTSPPTAEYFEIPDDYESNEFQLSTPPG